MPKLLTEHEAADRLGMTPRFLEARRSRGDGPPFIRISARAIRYSESQLSEWLANRTYASTAEYGQTGEAA